MSRYYIFLNRRHGTWSLGDREGVCKGAIIVGLKTKGEALAEKKRYEEWRESQPSGIQPQRQESVSPKESPDAE